MKRRRGALDELSFHEYDDGDGIRDTISYQFWKWYDIYADMKIVSLKFLVFPVTVRVRHLTSLFEILFGDRPY